jgi:hypothetical protein
MEQVANRTAVKYNELENLPMPGKIVNHVPRLIRERYPKLLSLPEDIQSRELAKELSFGARVARGTATNLVDPNYDPKAIYFDVLIGLCDFFGVGTSEIFEYVPE